MGFGDLVDDAWDTVTGQTDYRAGAFRAESPTGETFAGYRDPEKDRRFAESAINQDRAMIGQDRGAVLRAAAGLEGLEGEMAGAHDYSTSLKSLSNEMATAPSAAALQSRAAMGQANADAMSRAASARGANSALMMREQQGTNAASSRQAAAEAAGMAANEMNQRYAARGSVLGAAAGAQRDDFAARADTLGAAAAGYGTAGNLGASLYGADTGMYDSAAGRALDYREALTDAELRAQDITASSVNAANSENAATNRSNASNSSNFISNAAGALAGALGLSDMRAKEDVVPLDFAVYGAPEGKQQGIEALKRVQAQTAPIVVATMDDGTDSEMKDPEPEEPKEAETPAVVTMNKPGEGIGALLGGGLKALSDARGKDRVVLLDAASLDTGRDAALKQIASIPTGSTVLPTPKQPAMIAIAADPQANREALDGVHPYGYRYKPEAAAKFGEDTAPRVGIMAQELETSPAGAQVVETTPGGEKAIDLNRAVSFSLAANAGLDKRIAQLEQAAGIGGSRFDQPQTADGENFGALSDAEAQGLKRVGSSPWGRTVYPTPRSPSMLGVASGVR